MDGHPRRFAMPGPVSFESVIAVALVALTGASCKPFPPEPVEPVEPVVAEVQPPPQASCGPAQPSTRELLVQWVSMTRENNPDLSADVARWIQMTQESGVPAPTRDRARNEKIDVEPSTVFGMATITVYPVGRDAVQEDKAPASSPVFECNGLVVHAKINSRVVSEAGPSAKEVGFVNLDSGLGYLVIDGRMTLDTRVKVDFPGNAFWEPMSEDFVLRDRIHPDGRIAQGESCSVFVLGSEKRDELAARGEPDRSVVPTLVALMQSAPSRHTRGLAAIHLGIVRDNASLQAMLDAFALEKDEQARADIALGLGILGDKAALGPIEEAATNVTGQDEIAWKYREAANRLKGRRH